MEQVAKQMVVTYQYSTIDDYQAVLDFTRTLFADNIEEFENILGKEFENAGIE